MGQGDIIKALELEDWLTVKELSKRVKVNTSTISSSMVRLLNNREVTRKYKKVDAMGKTYVYVYSLAPHMREPTDL